MVKFSKTTLQKMEVLFKDLEYNVRYEKGYFQSGYCIVEDKKIAIINKFFDTEARINCLIDILTSITVPAPMLSEESRILYNNILITMRKNLKEQSVV